MSTGGSNLTYVVEYHTLLTIMSRVDSLNWVKELTESLQTTPLPLTGKMIVNMLHLQRLSKLSKDGEIFPIFVQAVLGISKEHALEYIHQLPKPSEDLRIVISKQCTHMVQPWKGKPLHRCKKRSSKSLDGALLCGYHFLKLKIIVDAPNEDPNEPLPQKETTGVVYFIRMADTEMVKVGFTSRIAARISELQTGCPHELHLEYHSLRADCARDESAMHVFLRSMHVRGEWFRLPNGVDYEGLCEACWGGVGPHLMCLM